MVIHGRIIEVMESYPLQLLVDVKGINYYVGLLEDTTVTDAGRPVDADRLRPGLDVTISGEGSASSKTAMTAERIVLRLI